MLLLLLLLLKPSSSVGEDATTSVEADEDEGGLGGGGGAEVEDFRRAGMARRTLPPMRWRASAGRDAAEDMKPPMAAQRR